MLSVIIPTYNRCAQVARTIGAIASQRDVRDDVEVIVVVDGSTDDTVATLTALRTPMSVRVVEQAHAGQAAARNRGAALAQGAMLVFLDDDMMPHPDFLSRIQASSAAGADYVITTVRMGPWVPDTMLSREFKQWTSAPAGPDDTPVRYDEMLFSAHAVRRSHFEAVGGFDEAFTRDGGYGNEDVDLGQRLLRNRAVVRRCPAAIADTEPTLDAERVLERERLVGRNDVRLVQRYPELMSEVFTHKLTRSRAHRIAGTALLRTPWLALAVTPVRKTVTTMIAAGAVNSVLARAWSFCRAVQYWRGVIEAGGRGVMRSVTTSGS